MVASGDDGYENAQFAEYEKEKCLDCSPSFPAGLSTVIAVGGTTLGPTNESGRGWSEGVWYWSGSGCTLYATKRSWQTDKGCKERTDNDVAAVVDAFDLRHLWTPTARMAASRWYQCRKSTCSRCYCAGVHHHEK